MKRLLLLIAVIFSVASQAQRVGIGTTQPNAKLEIIGEGSNSLTNNLILKSLAGDTLLRLRNDGRVLLNYNGTSVGRTLNLGGNGMNFYRVDNIFGGSIFPTDTSLVIWSEIGDNNYINIQPQWGRVGIGTHSPQAKLDVNDDFKLGDSGTVLKHIIRQSTSRNLPSMLAGTSSIQTFTVVGANLVGTVYVSPSLELPDGLVIAYARVAAHHTVEVKFINVSLVTINAATTIFYITVIN